MALEWHPVAIHATLLPCLGACCLFHSSSNGDGETILREHQLVPGHVEAVVGERLAEARNATGR